MENLEMMICTRCGRPFPKRRWELGYKYCIQCSTEKPKSIIIEGTMDGEDCQTSIHVVTQEEAKALNKVIDKIKSIDTSDVPDMSTFESQDEFEPEVDTEDEDSEVETENEK